MTVLPGNSPVASIDTDLGGSGWGGEPEGGTLEAAVRRLERWGTLGGEPVGEGGQKPLQECSQDGALELVG